MTQPSPSYSVVIPAYNAAATLGEAIASLQGQTLPPAQIIVVDDGSTDGTAAIARGCGHDIRVIVQANAGPGAASTRGFAEVATPLVAFIDSDDLWLPHKAQRQVEHLTATPALAGLAVLGRLFRDGEAATADGEIQEMWSRTGLMIWTDRARSVGPFFDPPGRRGETIDWLMRARAVGLRIDMLHEVLTLRRVRRGSLSSGRGPNDIGYLHVVRAELERKRARTADRT